ncbi:MAG: hypothetical protein HF981_23720 [Desulfobacteraceae bacterium]|nr:hypothetical protein [Desulfobacteraceae bacterium]MBC2753427.1 PD40 domain-containing protein [Desulfobacteraceae bacterium]
MLAIVTRTTSLLGLLIVLSALIDAPVSARPENTPLKYINLIETWDAATARTSADDLLAHMSSDVYLPEIVIGHPDDGAVFPPNMAAPHFFWNDTFLFSDAWLVVIEAAGGERVCCFTDQPRWVPEQTTWNWLLRHMGNNAATLTIIGVNRSKGLQPVNRTQITFSISPDPFDGVLFYKQTRLPFLTAREHPEQSAWVLADITAYEPPRTVLTGVRSCAHCHTFSPNGQVFGMDVDRNGDKGGYLLAPVTPRMQIDKGHFISWNTFGPEDGRSSMGLFTKVSPCGRYLVSTVKETSLFAMLPDIWFSQLFFPIEGYLAVYDRGERRFAALPGADRTDAVQTCPAWSPDGQTVAFARAPVNAALVDLMQDKKYLTPAKGETIADLNRRYRIRFDLYTLPFNHGNGGKPMPLEGASQNGRSNYFPRYSPDGRWIAFNQSDTGLVLQPDSALYLIPAEGGKARRMRCNTGRMNSWHSWSPNSRWLVFASKAITPYTELLLTHVDAAGNDSPPVALSRLNRKGFAAVLPEVIPQEGSSLECIRIGAGVFAGKDE